MKYFGYLFFLSLLTSCASAPTQEDIDNADYGNSVATSKCIMLAKSFISNKLKDPSSAQFNNVNCYRGWEGNVPIAGVKATYGYRFVGNVNAKNSFGGYTGYTPFSGIVRDDGYGARVIRYCMVSSTDEYGICLSQMVN